MNTRLHQGRKKLQLVMNAASRFLLAFKRKLLEQFNKNLYTRILFTNVTVFIFALLAVTLFSGFVVKQAVYDQVQQELLRKAKRVNYALLQQKELTWATAPRIHSSGQSAGQQDLLKFLADSFDARITVFDRQGEIIGTSAEQEVVPGSKVDAIFNQLLARGEPAAVRQQDKETGQLIISAVVPMGNNKDAIENGILLETKPANLDLALNSMRLYLLSGAMAILIIIIIVSVYLAMYISRPISRLATTVAEISRGSYVFNDDDQPLDEINILAGQLNKLTVRLQKIQAESCRMEEEKARLFAEISHELRTPLTSVQGFVEAIRDGMVQDEALQEKYLDTIYTQTVHISRLVDDMLVLSRLESGNITVEKLPVDLIALAQGVVVSMEGLAKSNNASIVIEKNAEKAFILGDVDRIEQIMRNLLKNAVKATENGTIRVGVKTRQDEVILNIEDNGVGIPPEDLPHIWDRFYRGKNQRGNMQEKGTGLGLVIVKKLVQLQDGKIDVTSQLGKGTTFSLSFPAYKPQ